MKHDYSQLLFDIQKKSNITVKNIKDLKILKEELEFVIQSNIGFNTLRRLFGFLEKREPNLATLNKMAKYLGYASFSNYKHQKTNYNDWYFQQYLLLINKFTKINQTQINQINLGLLNEKNVVYLGYFLNYHIEKNNIDLLKTIFEKIEFNQVSNTQLHKFGIIVSLILTSLSEKKVLKIYEELIPYDNFRNYIPLLHIDYTNLHNRYFKVLQLIRSNNATSSDLLFTELMYYYKAFYVEDTILPFKIKKPNDFDSFHITLKGRYYGMKLLCYTGNLDAIKKEILLECKTNKISFFLIEIILALIFNEEYDFLEKLLTQYYEEVFEDEVWSSETTNAIYLIGLSNVNLKNKNIKIAKKNLELIQLEKVEIGYFDYVNLFYNLTILKISYYENDEKTNKMAQVKMKDLITKTKFKAFERVLLNFQISNLINSK
jgi:hypothetical protein